MAAPNTRKTVGRKFPTLERLPGEPEFVRGKPVPDNGFRARIRKLLKI